MLVHHGVWMVLTFTSLVSLLCNLFVIKLAGHGAGQLREIQADEHVGALQLLSSHSFAIKDRDDQKLVCKSRWPSSTWSQWFTEQHFSQISGVWIHHPLINLSSEGRYCWNSLLQIRANVLEVFVCWFRQAVSFFVNVQIRFVSFKYKSSCWAERQLDLYLSLIFSETHQEYQTNSSVLFCVSSDCTDTWSLTGCRSGALCG